MKKLLTIILSIICITCFGLFFTACGDDNSKNDDEQIVAVYNTYVAYAESNGQTPLSYEDWLASIKGEKGDDGVGIESVRIDENGHLKIKYTNSELEIDLGKVKETIQYSQGLEFELNEEQTGYILTGVGYCNDRKVVIPNEYNGKPVVSIGDSAINEDDFIKAVVIPDSVTSIGERAFTCCWSLQSVTIGDSVKSIGKDAFNKCDSLKYNVKDGLNYLGNDTNPYLYLAYAKDLNITTANIDNNCKFIGSSAFDGCSSLKEIAIPNSVTSIGEMAFSRCSSLERIEVGKDNINYKSIDGNLYSKDEKTLIQYAIGKTATSFTIPNSVESIGERAFYYCRSLTTINIPNSVESIGNYAFYNCSSLQSVTIGNSVESIGEMAFYECSSLESIEIPNSVTSIGEYAFIYCSSLTIYCEAESKPSGWDDDWNYSDCPVLWGQTGEES